MLSVRLQRERNLRRDCVLICTDPLSSADVLPSHSLHPQSAPEEDPLLHLPADDAAAGAVHVRHVPHPVHEDDLPSGHDPANPNQVPPETQVHLSLCFGIN